MKAFMVDPINILKAKKQKIDHTQNYLENIKNTMKL